MSPPPRVLIAGATYAGIRGVRDSHYATFVSHKPDIKHHPEVTRGAESPETICARIYDAPSTFPRICKTRLHRMG